MKRNYFIIAAAVAIFAACAGKEEIKEIISSEGPQISFSTYAQKATRAENSDSTYTLNLKDHHLTFKVWGYKNTDKKAVFNGDSVGYSNNQWSYIINRYWDKTATTYEFYAFAPENAPLTFNGVDEIESQKDGYFAITSSYNKVGANRSPKNAGNPVIVWNDFDENTDEDVDLMIADTCRLSGSALTAAQADKVTLNFIHILSRLNITIKTIDGFDPTVATNDSICIDSIIISNFAHAGTFSEKNGNVNANDLKAGTTKRWIATDKAEYKYEIDYTATKDKTYAIEALMIPQEIAKDTINLDGTFPTETVDKNAPYIKIAYSIYSYNPKDSNKANNKEHYIAYYNLAKIFKAAGDKLAFNEGWQNTLNITISPAVINFDAHVAPWADQKIEDLTIY